MVKFLGCSLIVAASIIAGLSYTGVLRKRIKGISFMIELLSALKIKISYEFSAIPELLKEMQCKDKQEGGIFLINCLQYLDGGKDLKSAWNMSVDKFSQEMFLAKKDTDVLKDFSVGLGDSDVNGQITNISLYLEMLKTNLTEAENILKEKSRVTLSCSIFGSLLFSILLI